MLFIVIFILVAGIISAVVLNKRKSTVVEAPAKVEEVILTPKVTPAKPKVATKKPSTTTAKKQPVKK
jgi:hypothetical protein